MSEYSSQPLPIGGLGDGCVCVGIQCQIISNSFDSGILGHITRAYRSETPSHALTRPEKINTYNQLQACFRLLVSVSALRKFGQKLAPNVGCQLLALFLVGGEIRQSRALVAEAPKIPLFVSRIFEIRTRAVFKLAEGVVGRHGVGDGDGRDDADAGVGYDAGVPVVC